MTIIDNYLLDVFDVAVTGQNVALVFLFIGVPEFGGLGIERTCAADC